MSETEAEERIKAGARALAARFAATLVLADHFAIVDEPRVQKQIDFLRWRHKALWGEEIKPVIDASWVRVGSPTYRRGDRP